MQEINTLALIQDLVILTKRFPNLRLGQKIIGNLTHSEYELLLLLGIKLSAERPAISVSDISAMLQITPAGVTQLINSLEAKNYIERRPGPNDRRIVLIALTEQGQEAAQILLADMQKHIAGLVSHLGEQDSQTLFSLVYRAITYFSAQGGKSE